jgi:hypothetical protein
MRTIISLSLTLALWGCPTPPDGATQGGGNNNPGAGGDMPPPLQGGTAGEGGMAGQDFPEADPNATVGTYVVTNTPNGDPPLMEGEQPTSAQGQAFIKESEHVIFKGEIICDDCSASLLIKVAPFVPPTDEPGTGATGPGDDSGFQPPAFEVGGPGPFTMAVPKYAGKVVLEVLDDRDGNGRPSRGEKFTVLHDMGKITAGKNQSGLKIDFAALTGQPGGPEGGPAGGPEGGPAGGPEGGPAGGPPPAGDGEIPPEGPPSAQ